MHAGKVTGYSVITTAGVPGVVCVCVCVCVCICAYMCVCVVEHHMCVSSLVYWQICPSSIRINWPQWWRTLIYLAWASHWSTHNHTIHHTHTHTHTCAIYHCIPYRTLADTLNIAELRRSKRTMRDQKNSASLRKKASSVQISFQGGREITNVAFKAASITHWSAQ